MSTLHILSSPVHPVHIDKRYDAFGVAIYKFIQNMQKLGWNCIHYGIQGCDVPCTTVICLPVIGGFNSTDLSTYNKNAGAEIRKRKKPDDIILCFYGCENKEAAEMNGDLLIVEPGIGYNVDAVFAPYRVFTSYAQQHMFYGLHSMLMDPGWFDEVIPNGFTPSEFEFSEIKKDYLLYFGRIIESKGVKLAIDLAEKTNHKLIIAGTGDLKDIGYNTIPSHVSCVGYCGVEQRRILMRDARAILGPSLYVEPFGNMVVEGYFSGTPAITSDWGGFVDTVIPGITGYRCRDFETFVRAVENLDKIDPKKCRLWAEENFSEEIVHTRFHMYFKKLQALKRLKL